jgi:hypothetical protein
MAATAGIRTEAGISNSKTLEIGDRAALEGITPLEVMHSVMKARLEAGDQDGALIAANMAAPYMHSRLAATHRKEDQDRYDLGPPDRAER